MNICGKTEMLHNPVLASEVIEYLIPASGECRFIDCTLGYGGHSILALKKNPNLFLLGIDRDINAVKYSSEALKEYNNRICIKSGKFSEIEKFANSIGWQSVDAVLMDIGVSSPQIDIPGRGFAFRDDGPLDMRMDSNEEMTASYVLNHYTVERLTWIFREYGEIKQAFKLATAIVERRTFKPWMMTKELAELCDEVLTLNRKSGPPAPTLCFQALRIEVNNELKELENAVKSTIGLLKIGGRIGVISYHSLEDRIVKTIFKLESTGCICSTKYPICVCGHKASIKLLTKKPVIPVGEEIMKNRRASSAKMRVAEKIYNQITM